jgi:PelA/Pel-15E family pectate lyase
MAGARLMARYRNASIPANRDSSQAGECIVARKRTRTTTATWSRLCLLAFTAMAATWMDVLADEPTVTREQAVQAMRKAGAYWAGTVASHGGYVWEYSTDLVTRRRGESGDLPPTTVWVQAGTPMVGEVFLDCYEATAESLFLDAAVDAAHCLAWGQLKSGGWTYSIEFDLTKNKYDYHHLPADVKGLRNTTTFDDNNTQSATRFLMRIDQVVDDPIIKTAVKRALECFLKAQVSGGNWDGAWPQRFPPPKKGYGRLPTFNDNTMSDCVRTMADADRYYKRSEYRDSVRRCLEFYLRAQQPPPQTAWPQQVDEELKPAWARKFEPPSITGGESRGNCMLLLDMYLEYGDQRYLQAVANCVDWYKRVRIGGTPENGVWARFYEVGTDKPLYFTKTYELTYDDSDLPVHYSFKSNYGVNSMIRRFEHLQHAGREAVIAEKNRKPTPEENTKTVQKLGEKVSAIIAEQDDRGRWVKKVPKTEQVRDKDGRVKYVKDENTMLDMMYSRSFVANMRTMAKYVAALKQPAQD